MKGYKVFNPDWTCKDMQYEVGKSYEMEEKPVICKRGFHFCEKAVDCFQYYNFDSDNKVAEIEAFGELDFEEDKKKHCTNKIKIIRELNWHEVLNLVNTGKMNSGNNNSGNGNSGNGNSGNGNSGNWNSGGRNSRDWNSGNNNSGNWNSGNCNSGNNNSGNGNSGDWNSGNWNSGGRNSRDWNSGNNNSGNGNSGDWNSGNWNSGGRNSGDWNSGNNNSGNWNSGNWNSGNWNSGDWNSASNCAGCFNTISQPLMFFDKPSNLTFKQWQNSDAFQLLNKVNFKPAEWISSNNMTEIEKENHPEYKVTCGYLKLMDNSKCCLEWWEGLTDCEKEIIKSIPNFDSKKFHQITGIQIE